MAIETGGSASLDSLREEIVTTLRCIASIAGNLPDSAIEGPTGPRDAAHRGLMVIEARRLAREMLAKIQEQS